MKVVCDYCNNKAELVDSSIVYQKSYGLIWYCSKCQAWVGVHKNSKKNVPLGRLANKELRKYKIKAHFYFDRLWKAKIRRDNCTKKEARKAAYRWLSDKLNINIKKCHIGKFDTELCKKTIKVCKNIGVNNGST